MTMRKGNKIMNNLMTEIRLSSNPNMSKESLNPFEV